GGAESLLTVIAKADSTANRILSRPISTNERFVDDDNRSFCRIIATQEITPSHQREAKRREISRSGNVCACNNCFGRRPPLVRHHAFRHPYYWRCVRKRRVLYARQGTHMVEHAAVKRHAGDFIKLGFCEIQSCRQQSSGLKTGIRAVCL